MKYKLIKDDWNMVVVINQERTRDITIKYRGIVFFIIKKSWSWIRVGRFYSYSKDEITFESDDLEEVKQMGNLEAL